MLKLLGRDKVNHRQVVRRGLRQGGHKPHERFGRGPALRSSGSAARSCPPQEGTQARSLPAGVQGSVLSHRSPQHTPALLPHRVSVKLGTQAACLQVLAKGEDVHPRLLQVHHGVDDLVVALAWRNCGCRVNRGGGW